MAERPHRAALGRAMQHKPTKTYSYLKNASDSNALIPDPPRLPRPRGGAARSPIRRILSSVTFGSGPVYRVRASDRLALLVVTTIRERPPPRDGSPSGHRSGGWFSGVMTSGNSIPDLRACAASDSRHGPVHFALMSGWHNSEEETGNPNWSPRVIPAVSISSPDSKSSVATAVHVAFRSRTQDKQGDGERDSTGEGEATTSARGSGAPQKQAQKTKPKTTTQQSNTAPSRTLR